MTGRPLRRFVQDLSERDVRNKITEPFNDGVSLWIGNELLEGNFIDHVAVFKTERRFTDLLYGIRSKYDLNAASDDIWVYLMEGKIGDDVSNLFVKSRLEKESKSKTVQKLSKNVFIVHGRDHEPMKELKTMLLDFGLNPIVLHEQPSGSRTIVEKLEKFSDVGYAFVLLTPDDLGCSEEKWAESKSAILDYLPTIPEFLKDDPDLRKEDVASDVDGLYKMEMNSRARQNVILEFGYFIGLLSRDRVCCLHKGDVELPSDMHGIVYIAFKESVNEARDMIKEELREAGYEVKK